MIDSAGRTHTRACAEGTVSVASRSNAAQSQSFAAELSASLASTTKRDTLPPSLPASQQNVTRQIPGGANSPASGGASSSTSSAGSQPSGLSGLVINFPSGTSAAATSATTSESAEGTATSAQSATSFDQAYWASQPAAVQQLQDISDPQQRTAVATQLAQEGYTIDVPIMVWGWDPATTMAARASMGYSWVPSALQQPVDVAPGLTYAGNSYSSTNPPAGSITV